MGEAEDGLLVGHRGVADVDLEEEPVELGLGQRVGPLVFDRVLGGDHQERLWQRVGDAVDADLRLLHGLEEGGLGLGRRAVDLVGQQHVGEDGPGPEGQVLAAAAVAEPQRHRPRQVRREHVGGELHPAEVEPEGRRPRPGEEGLGHARHALQEDVTADDGRGEEQVNDVVLAHHHPADLGRHPVPERGEGRA